MRDTQFRTIFYFAHKHGYFRRSPAQQYNYMIKKISLVKTRKIAPCELFLFFDRFDSASKRNGPAEIIDSLD